MQALVKTRVVNHRGVPVSSAFPGVSWDKNAKKWQARYRDEDSVCRSLGYYVHECDAGAAYAAWLSPETSRLEEIVRKEWEDVDAPAGVDVDLASLKI